jgi:hypothetical protein
MFGKALSTGNRISMSLVLFLVPAVTCVLAPKGVLAATPAEGEDDQAKQVFWADGGRWLLRPGGVILRDTVQHAQVKQPTSGGNSRRELDQPV